MKTKLPTAVQQDKKLVTVCADCLMASCWQGEFVCQSYMTADTIQKPVKELRKLNREHAHFWKSDEELANG